MVQLSFEIPTLEEVLVRTVASLGMTTVLEPPCIVSMVLGDLHLSTLNHGHDFQLLMTRVAWCSSLGSSDYIFCFELGMALKPKAHVELVIHVWLAFSHVTSPQLLLWLHFFFFKASRYSLGISWRKGQKLFVAVDNRSSLDPAQLVPGIPRADHNILLYLAILSETVWVRFLHEVLPALRKLLLSHWFQPHRLVDTGSWVAYFWHVSFAPVLFPQWLCEAHKKGNYVSCNTVCVYPAAGHESRCL